MSSFSATYLVFLHYFFIVLSLQCRILASPAGDCVPFLSGNICSLSLIFLIVVNHTGTIDTYCLMSKPRNIENRAHNNRTQLRNTRGAMFAFVLQLTFYFVVVT